MNPHRRPAWPKTPARCRASGSRLRHDGPNPEVAINEDPTGEFALTRDIKRLATEHDAELVVTGVYTYGKYNTIVAMKAIDRDGNVRKAFNYTVPATVSFDWDRHSLGKFRENNANNKSQYAALLIASSSWEANLFRMKPYGCSHFILVVSTTPFRDASPP